MPFIDISPPVGPETAVWPGDQAYTVKSVLKLEEGASVALSSVTTTLHVGAHADAPSHYRAQAAGIDRIDLDPYWGPCLVFDAIGERCIKPGICPRQLPPGVTRILFKTLTMPDWRIFNEDFSYFDPEAIDHLAALGVVLVGIDTPSVDAFSSKELPAHHALLRHGIRNLEGLWLAEAPAGIYELSALPLRLQEGDASPVRAVLRTGSIHR